MSSNMKAFSITHIISVLVGGATVIAVTAIEFTHNPNFSPLYAFLQASSYAGIIGYYATSLKASASGISETTKPQ